MRAGASSFVKLSFSFKPATQCIETGTETALPPLLPAPVTKAGHYFRTRQQAPYQK
ncbi:hypothetical protein SAMN05518801_13120 [Novosphingobium sp. CF614]|nr:hypothetical protein SAMN05518801_13120 [Novosphingobium sp. CF614]